MRVSSPQWLALVALPLLVLGYTANHGFYSPLAMGLVLAAAVLVMVAALRPPRALRLPPAASLMALYAPLTVGLILLLRAASLTDNPLLAMLYGVIAAMTGLVGLLSHLAGLRQRDPVRALLVGVGLLLAMQGLLVCQLRYPDPDRLAASLGLLVASFLALLVWLSFLAQPVPGKGWTVRLGLLLGLGLALRGLAIVGSPAPIIDVNSWLQQAPQMLLAGRNPYAAEYASPYGTPAAQAQGIHDAPDPHPATYPPLALLTGLPAALLGADGRWVNVLADLLAALLLVLGTRRLARSELGLLAAGLYLGLPRTPFMIEQAWFEPQLAALAGAMLLWGRSRPGLAGVMLGLLLAGKQFAVVLLPVALKASWSNRRLWAAAAVTVAVLVLPFVLWSPGDFWTIVVGKHLARPVIPHALTVLALAQQVGGVALPPWLTLLAAMGLIGWLTWRGPRTLSPAAGLWLGAALLAFILGHKQGYFNYYVLATYLLLWGIAGGEEAGEDH